MLLKYSLFQGHKMAFEAEMCVYWAPIPFKYIEFGFDKVKVHQLLDTCNKHPCSCIYYADTVGNFSETNLETTKSIS